MSKIGRRALLKTTGVVGGASALAVGGTALATTGSPGSSRDDPVQSFDIVTVFERGEVDDVFTFRIPLVTQAADGTLLAFAQARVDSADDFGYIKLVLKRSTDGGRTWGPLQVVAEDPDDRIANQSVVVDRETGRIHLFFVRTSGEADSQDINDGTLSPEDAPRPHVIHSDDHGATWSQWREITDDVKVPQMRHYVGGPTHGIQLANGPHAGRLIMPGNHTFQEASGDQPPIVGVHTFYSDDHGETWQLGGAIGAFDDTDVIPNETTLVELDDGTLYFNTRDHDGTEPGNRADNTSSDGGVTFDGKFKIAPHLVMPKVSASLWRQSGSGDDGDRLMISGPWHPSSRERMTIWSSFDDGASWRESLIVYDGPAGYSDLVRIGAPEDDTIGVLFENGPRLAAPQPLTYHQRISLARVPLAALDQPIPPPTITDDESGNGNDAVVSGSPEPVTGVFGQALELAGDYVEVPLETSIDVGSAPFTAALWFRTGEARQQRIMHAYNNGNFPQWFIEYLPDSRRLRARMRTAAGDTNAETVGEFADGQWHHVAVRRGDQNVWTLYVDGEEVAKDQADAGSVSTDALAGIRIGSRMDGINHPFVGAVDEIYLFNRALTAAQIRTLATDNTYPDGTALVHLPLEEMR